MTQRQPQTQSLHRQPAKWAIVVAALVLGYALIQPFANSRLGWNLPSAASLLGRQAPESTSDNARAVRESSQDQLVQHNSAVDAPESATLSPPSSVAKSDGATELQFGYLREIGPEDYVSPAGLRYTRGSREGHRLHHLARHLEDQPDRPGLHGVFRGDMKQVLQWLDGVYERGERGAEGTSKISDKGRTVYEAKFSEPVGYVGGRDGKRLNNPGADSIRLVTEGKRVITAFPFK